MAAYSGEIFWRCTTRYGSVTVLDRAALLRDDGPIGSNTVVESKVARENSNEVEFIWPDTYDGQTPIGWRIRFVLYGNANYVVPYPPYATGYDRFRYERWLVLISWCNYYHNYYVPSDPLPNYDPNDGTSHPNNLFSVPPGCVWTAGGARMIRCDGTLIKQPRYLDEQEWFGGSTDKQQPSPIDISYDDPVHQDTMFELEFAEYRVPQYMGEQQWVDGRFHTYREERYIYPVLEFYAYNRTNRQWEGPFYSIDSANYMLVVMWFRRPVYQTPPPFTSWAIHCIDKSHVAFAQTNAIADHNLFSLGRIERWYYFPTTYSVTRVRYLPRYRTVLALGKYGTAYSLKMYELGTHNWTEVVSLTATSAMIEIAEDQRTVLLVYSLSDNSVYRRISRDGGWTWGTAQQCTLSGGGNLSAQAVTDLDYSPRRRCWFLVAQTGTSTFKVYASEDGLQWTDTGL